MLGQRQEGAGGSAEIQGFVHENKRRCTTSGAAQAAGGIRANTGTAQLVERPSRGGTSNTKPSSGNVIMAATAVQADAATMRDEVPHQGEAQREGLDERDPTPIDAVAVASNQPTAGQEPAEQSATTCLAFEEAAGSRPTDQPLNQASHVILDSIKTGSSAEDAGGRASEERDDTSIEARILAVACISLAYMRQLEEGGAAQADEVRNCLLRTLLLDPEILRTGRNSLMARRRDGQVSIVYMKSESLWSFCTRLFLSTLHHMFRWAFAEYYHASLCWILKLQESLLS